jgi:hypothetical protein
MRRLLLDWSYHSQDGSILKADYPILIKKEELITVTKPGLWAWKAGRVALNPRILN